MKKNIFKLCFIGILLQAINFAKSDNAQLEIYFYNDISNEITVHAYPIGMIMNGYSQYNLIAKRQRILLTDALIISMELELTVGTKDF